MDVIETVISLAKEENDTWITLIFIDVTAGWSFNNEQVTGNKKKSYIIIIIKSYLRDKTLQVSAQEIKMT